MTDLFSCPLCRAPLMRKELGEDYDGTIRASWICVACRREFYVDPGPDCQPAEIVAAAGTYAVMNEAEVDDLIGNHHRMKERKT